MPPKRKTTGGGKKGSKKAKKAPTPEEVPPISPSNLSDGSERNEVRWGFPTTAKDNDAPDRSDNVTQFAPTFYDQDWNTLITREIPFGFPRIRSPYYKTDTATVYNAPGSNRSQTSQAVLDLFNLIKRETGRQQGPYNRHAFDQAFGNDDDDLAVVASGSAAHRVLALTQDYRVQITIRDGDRDGSAHVDFLRRAPPTQEAAEHEFTGHGYFIELPPGTRVTVNGHTYVNDQNPREEVDNGGDVAAATPSPFIIGPLTRYTVIELLSQPIFFFRSQDDLVFWNPIPAERGRPSAEELNNRDNYGAVAAEHVTVTWTPTSASAPGSRESSAPPGSPEGNSQDGDSNPALTGPELPARASSHTSESSAKYDDTWMDGGEAIEDACDYVRRHLLEPQQRQYQDLIPRVVAAINDRQPQGAGFSFEHNDRIFRSGRTLIAPLQHHDHHVLLVAQVQADRHITLRILDPMAWRSTRPDRNEFSQLARQLLVSERWWQHAYNTPEEMEGHLPEAVDWVPCAQHTRSEQSLTYTILNAWAVALGLEPDPSFRPNGHGDAGFFTRAQRLLDLALQDKLDWKLLLAFFRCSMFVKHDGEDSLPPQDRLFDQRVRSFQRSLARQTLADRNAAAGENESLTTDALDIRLEDGVPHTGTFASDDWEEADLESISTLVREGRWSLTDTKEQLVARRAPRLSTLSDPSGTQAATGTSPSGPKAPPEAPVKAPPVQGGTLPPPDLPNVIPRLDTSAIPEDFNPCQYVRDKLKKLENTVSIPAQAKPSAKNGKDQVPPVPRLSQSEVYQSIAAVVRALNEVHAPEHGFTLMGDEQKVITSASNPRLGFQDSITLRPHQVNGHTVLLVLQSEKNGAAQRAVNVYVVDSAPWTLTLEERAELYETLRQDQRLSEITMPETATWVLASQQIEAWQSEYFAVISAWALLFDLPLNLIDFHPGESFFRDANQLVRAVTEGHADWKLIWAFLRCANYVASNDAPGQGRRFLKTVPSGVLNGHIERMRARPAAASDQVEHAALGRHFASESRRAHNAPFPLDDLEPEEKQTWIPELKRKNRFDNNLTPEQIGNLYHNLPQDFNPCAYFRQRRNELLADHQIEANLRDFRDQEAITEEYGEWITTDEVSLGIAAVTLAITNFQNDIDLGFSFLAQTYVQLHTAEEHISNEEAIRPGRPWLVPIHHADHFVLLVIQLDENARPSYSVLDSKAFHMDRDVRNEIHALAETLVVRSHWRDHVFTPEQWKKLRPAHTTWIPVAQQPSDSECGYYTILNAWTLALGLQPNPDVHLDWNDEFFNDLKDLLHLARLNRVDWSMIYAFLRCRDFVLDGHVPLDRQFPATQELPNGSQSYLEDVVDGLHLLEQAHFIDTPNLDPQQLMNANRCALPPGRRHNQSIPSDKWNQDDRVNYASDLARHGLLDINQTRSQLKHAHAELCDLRGYELKKQLRAAKYKQLPVDKILAICRSFLETWHTGRDLFLQFKPCQVLRDTINFYEYVLGDGFIGNTLESEAFKADGSGNPLEASEINLAIAAVVEAIDRRQSEAHTDGLLFTGGFSLATSFDLEFGLSSADYEGAASRPRRCWLMPLSVLRGGLLDQLSDWRKGKGIKSSARGGRADGHHLLAVVQEEEGSFATSFYDSGAHVFGNSYDFLHEAVQRATKNLRWSTHRNAKGRVRQADTYTLVDVPQQLTGGWQCGAHVVINAWILAMGLTPAVQKVKFTQEMYVEFYTLARAACAGLLDWKTLVAWLFCNRLTTTERNLQLIQEDRKFSCTQRLPSEVQLRERIVDILRDEDDLLGELDESQAGYNFSSNVGYVEEEEEEEEQGEEDPDGIFDDEEEEEDDDGLDDLFNRSDNDDDEDAALNRSYDEPTLDLSNTRRRHRRRPRKQKTDALHFLAGYDVRVDRDRDGDVKMRDNVRGIAVKRSRRKVDKLLFLDAY